MRVSHSCSRLPVSNTRRNVVRVISIRNGILTIDIRVRLGCGNEINSPGAPISQSACNQACTGDSTEVCGGPNALQLYNFTGANPLGASVIPAAGGWTSQGCYRYDLSFKNF